MARQLKTSVEVQGRWYPAGARAGQEIPDADVEQIRNPKAWEYTDGDAPKDDAAGRKPVGAQLARRVDVDGAWYGPGDEIPADVAAKIRNPKAWEDGKVPAAAQPDQADGAAAKADTSTGNSTDDAGDTPAGRGDDAPEQDDEQDPPANPPARRGRRS